MLLTGLSPFSWSRVIEIFALCVVFCHLNSLEADPYHDAKRQESRNRNGRGFYVQEQQQNRQHHPIHFQEQQQRNTKYRVVSRSQTTEENATHKCIIEVPTISLTPQNYPHYRHIRKGSSNYFTLIETCCEGYQASRISGNTVCLPVCENCRNGNCIAPDQCQCYNEFVRNDNGDCVFTCPLGCLNGRCYLDGSCKCDQGYKLDETRKYCRPICSDGCAEEMRQNCSEPETCSCSKGYRLRNNGCEPTCLPDCGVGGSCTEPNICTCSRGYILRNGACQANCYQRCDHGVCLTKNRCICNEGYYYNEKTLTCIPGQLSVK